MGFQQEQLLDALDKLIDNPNFKEVIKYIEGEKTIAHDLIISITDKSVELERGKYIALHELCEFIANSRTELHGRLTAKKQFIGAGTT